MHMLTLRAHKGVAQAVVLAHGPGTAPPNPTQSPGQARKGQLSGVARLQTPWDKEAWPRAGWWVRGLGAFAVEDMSEHPVPTPFLPLGDFIGEVGRCAEGEGGVL